MTKAELIEGVAKSAGVSKADAERTIGAFFDHVVASAKKGDKVAWPGFGSFSASQACCPHRPQPADRRAREDRRIDGTSLLVERNPQDGFEPQAEEVGSWF